ncbi:type II toxin-antitoxin system RelE/ParE family toxin [Patescibacteria group bacterium]|nr:type II toxin-antitoxin system RelE/ParE family toxin [Patescibacteria group bacterium]MBU1123714.1 type II toxin-antitoxin system RelE/ParE family toxin [Patescibacteria group bacterium]
MKKYIFQYSRHAEREFLKLPKQIRKRINQKIQEYQKLKNPLDKAKRMSNSHYYRYRVGDYRIICRKDEDKKLIVLVIVKVGHR